MRINTEPKLNFENEDKEAIFKINKDIAYCKKIIKR